MKIARASAIWTLAVFLTAAPHALCANAGDGAGQDSPADSGGPEAGADAGRSPARGAAAPGIRHPLERGMTLGLLARAYGVPLETLISANGISDPSRIPAGTPILIPGARERLPVRPPAGSSRLALSWPVRGPVSSPFGSSPSRKRHAGIDIAADPRTPIRAADGGTVARVADNARYGLMVVIRHEDGYATWYGHTSALLVAKGDRVTRGQVIALVGETGNARGSHLHFEVRRGNVPVDPLPFLEARR